MQLLVINTTACVRAYRFEDRNDVDILALVFTGENGAAINENSRPVQTCQRHQAARHVLVATPDGDHAIEAFAGRDRFN